MILFFIFIIHSAFAWAGIIEIQGLTLAEKRIRWMWQNVSTVLFSCSYDKTGCADPNLAPTIKALLELVPSSSEFDVQARQNQLEFKHEKEMSFETDKGETHRIAMTSLKKGSVIYFNRDRIESGPSIPYDYDFYLGLIVHELVHHLGIADDERRLPDQVGAYVAGYFKSKFLASPQGLALKDDISLNVFNAEGPVNWSMMSFELSGDLYDVQTSQNDLTPPCDKKTDIVIRQELERPRWRITRLNILQKTLAIEGSTLANNTCKSFFSPPKTEYTKTVLWTAKVYFNYASTMNETNWDQMTPALNRSISNVGSTDNADLISVVKNSIYTLKPTLTPSSKVGPGVILNYEFEFSDDLKMKFDGCSANFTSENWSWFDPGGVPKTITTPTCLVIDVNSTLRKVFVTYQVPSSVVTLPLQLYNVTFYAKNNFLLGYPSRPLLNFVSGNRTAGKAPLELKFSGVKPLDRLGEQPLINSYVTDQTDQFGIHLEVDTSAEILRSDFDLLILFNDQGHLGSSPYAGPLNADRLLLQDSRKNVESSKTTIDLSYKIPLRINTLGSYGVKVNAFSLLTEHLEQITVQFPKAYESFIMSPRLLH